MSNKLKCRECGAELPKFNRYFDLCMWCSTHQEEIAEANALKKVKEGLKEVKNGNN